MSRTDTMQGVLRQFAGRIATTGVLQRFAIALAAIGLSLVVGSVIILAIGQDPILFVQALVFGAIGTPGQIAFTLRKSTMLILAGLAVALAFRANVFNIGVQGQLVVGGFFTAMTIILLAPVLPDGALGGLLLISLGLIAGIIGGGLYAAIPGLMLAYADANEVITTIMLNFIATGVLFVLVDGPLKDPEAPAPKTVDFPDYVSLPSILLDSGNFSVIGLLIALTAVAIVAVVLSNTAFGYDLRTSGRQAPAAAFSGVDAERTIVTTMVFSGMVAGLCGAVYAVMVVGYYQDPGVTPTFGFTGIAVSLLAANNPLAVIPSGLLFGGLAAGQQFVDINLALPKELVDGIVGLLVLFVATPELFRMARNRMRSGDDRG